MYEFSWLEPDFPLNYIYDLGTYFLLTLIFFYLHKIKVINSKLLLISIIFLFTPFFFNGLLFDWTFLPDQNKYVQTAEDFRSDFSSFYENEENYTYAHLKITLPSLFYAISPIVSLETIKGIALWNRALFLFSWIFFAKKKYLNSFNSILFLMSPSLILYSSVSLRENLIILLMFWFIYFWYEKKKLLMISVLIIISLIKPQNLFMIFLFFIFNKIFLKNKINFKFLILVILSGLIIYFFLVDDLLLFINHLRKGFYLEQYGSYVSLSAPKIYKEISLDLSLESLILSIIGLLNFILSPIFKNNISLLTVIIFFEGLIITGYILLSFKLNYFKNKYIIMKWIIILIINFWIYSLIVFNEGTMHRYKTPMLFFIIFGYFANTRKLNLK